MSYFNPASRSVTIININIILTLMLILGFVYNSFYKLFSTNIETLALLGFWLAFPLSLAIIALSLISIIDKKGSKAVAYITLIIALVIVGIDLYSLVFVNGI